MIPLISSMDTKALQDLRTLAIATFVRAHSCPSVQILQPEDALRLMKWSLLTQAQVSERLSTIDVLPFDSNKEK